MKKIAGFLACLIAFAPINSVSATTINDDQKGLISTNCASIKMQLEKVQKADAKNRVHLGAQYETILTNLMMNLNLRLVKNNLADATIAAQQTTFRSERNRFKDDYIGYSQELDKLIDMDCRDDQQKFYDQLELVRYKREDVNKSIQRMNEILEKHYSAILNFRKGLSR